jgi:hypothetical protein
MLSSLHLPSNDLSQANPALPVDAGIFSGMHLVPFFR